MALSRGVLGRAIGTGGENDRNDVIGVKRLMQELGFYQPPPEGLHDAIDANFDRAIRDFQERNGLKIDGLLLPGGETERKLIAHATGEGFERVDPAEIAIGGGGFGGANDTADVTAIKRAMGALGRYSYDRTRPPPPYIDGKLVSSVEAFQRDNGLFDDGLIAPGGETLLALRAALSAKARPDHFLSERAGRFDFLPRFAPDGDATMFFPANRQNKAATDGSVEFERRERLAQSGARSFHVNPVQSYGSPARSGALSGQPPKIFNPTGGVERNDPIGLGRFGAPRDRGRRRHEGLDLTAQLNMPVVSPIDGRVVRRGKAYANDNRFDIVEIEGTGKYLGLRVKLFYVDRNGPGMNAAVKAGKTALGNLQDLRTRYGPAIKPHVHLEILWQGKRIDPAKVMP